MQLIRPTAALGLVAGFAVSASAQMDVAWDTAADGLWSNGASWTGGSVPGTLDTAVIGLAGLYTATFDSSDTLAGVNITNPDAIVLMRSSTSMTLEGPGLMSNGAFIMGNLSNNSATFLNLRDGGMLSGQIFFNPTGNLETRIFVTAPTTAGTSVAIAPSTFITGSGRFTGRQWNNAGSLLPDNNTMNLFVTGWSQSGDGNITASNGSSLLMNSISINGGEVNVLSGSVLNGSSPTFTDVDTTFESDSRLSANVTFNGGSISGDTVIRSAQAIAINPGVTFDPAGSITVGDLTNNSATFVNLSDGASIRGDIIFNPTGNAETRAFLQAPTDADTSITLLPGTTITGSGRFTGRRHNSAAAILADNNTHNFFLNTFDQSTGGSITGRNGSTLIFNNAQVIEGSVSLESGSTLTGSAPQFMNVDTSFEAGTLLSANTSFTGGSISGDVTIRSAQAIAINPGVTFDASGSITVGNLSNNSATFINLADGASIRGSILFNPTANAETRAFIQAPTEADTSITLLPGTSITGSGRFTGRRHNSAAALRPDGNTHNLFVTTFDQTTGGTIIARNSSVLILNNANIIEGSISIESGSRINGSAPLLTDVDTSFEAGTVLAANATFSGGTLSGDVTIRTAQAVAIAPGLAINPSATITLGDQSSNSATFLNIADDASVGGTVIFNPTANAETRAFLQAPTGVGESASMDPGTRVQGTGRLTGTWDSLPATFAPGFFDAGGGVDVAGVINFFIAPSSMTDDTVLEIDLTGPGANDRILTTVATTLDGTVQVSDANGFTPPVNTTSVVVDGPYSGQFDELNYTGSPPAGFTGRLFYDTFDVLFAVVCEPDFALPVGTINVFDILAFLEVWNNQAQGADYDNSGAVNIFDILAFLADWNAGCP